MIIFTKSEKETEAAGAAFASKLPDGAVAALYGDLGAGKTAFVRGMARGMGIDAHVSSPTFTIVNEYFNAPSLRGGAPEGGNSGSRILCHFDMYRLGGADELFDIGWEDYLRRGAVCAVEWSEHVEDAFEGDEIKVRIEKLSDSERKIEIEDKQPC